MGTFLNFRLRLSGRMCIRGHFPARGQSRKPNDRRLRQPSRLGPGKRTFFSGGSLRVAADMAAAKVQGVAPLQIVKISARLSQGLSFKPQKSFSNLSRKGQKDFTAAKRPDQRVDEQCRYNTSFNCGQVRETSVVHVVGRPRDVGDAGGDRDLRDLPLNFHPAAVRVSEFCTPCGAGEATGDRRSWSVLRSRASVAVRLAA